MKKKNTVNINKYLVIGVLFLLAIIIARIIYVAVATEVDGTNLKKFANNRNTVKSTLYATRGGIFDVTGEILAQTVNSYTVIAFLSDSRTTNDNDPQHVVDVDNTAKALAPILNMEESYLKKLLTSKAYQVELGPGGRNISELTKEKIEVLDLPGISFTKSSKRYYKMGDFASYIIGYARKNDQDALVGEMGIESYYNKELKGNDGYKEYQRDAYGYQIPNTPSLVEEPESGVDIYLTIDNNIQILLENSLEELNKNELTWAHFTIADAKTGAIVGSASTPSFNLNTLENIQSYMIPLNQLTYEPGSTMKIFSFMAAIENGVYNGDELYKSGSLDVSNYTISDFNEVGFGTISYDQGFANSSNVAAANLGLKMGHKKLKKFYDKLGFGKETGITLPNEAEGSMTFTYDVEVAAAAYGQGITTTPIQNIQALTSVANGGVMLKPYIVDKIVDSNTNEVLYQGGKKEIDTVCSPETANKMLDLMHKAVYDGATTATFYQADNVTLVGKTGTAQIPAETGGYLSGKYNYISSFAGVFPYENPRYVLYISVKQLVGSTRAVADVVKKVVEEVANYKNITETENSLDKSKIIALDSYVSKNVKDQENVLKKQGLNPIIIGDGETVIKQYPKKGTTITSGNKVFLLTNSVNYTMADIKGYSQSEAISYCNLIGLKYSVEGYGKVNSTNIKEGTVIKKNDKISIVLK